MLRKRVGKHISFHFDKREDSVFKFPKVIEVENFGLLSSA